MATASVLVDEPIVDEIIMSKFEPETTDVPVAVTDRGTAASESHSPDQRADNVSNDHAAAQEIADDLQTALDQFTAIAGELKE